MNILKHFNHKFSAGVPVSVRDRYYNQDLARDFRFLQDQLGQLAYDLTGQRMPIRMSGGVVTQGSGTTLNITAGNGWVQFNVTYPNDLSTRPGTVSTGDLMGVPVAWTQQTNMAIPSAVADSVTLNYVKIQYAETDGNTRAYAKKSGTYSYESVPSFSIVVNSVAPTQYDLCIKTFTLTDGGVFSFNDPQVVYPVWSDLHYMPVGSSIDWSGAYLSTNGSLSFPNSWMLEDGSSLLRANYSALWNILQTTVTGVFTTSLSTNTVFTQTSHPFIMGDCVSIISTTGALGSGLNVETKYYVSYLTANTFKLSSSYSGAVAGTGLQGTTAGTGNITMRWNPWGIASATTFNLPDSRGLSSEGAGQQGTSDWGGANYIGRLGQYKQDRFQAWQLGASADDTGALNYWTKTEIRGQYNTYSATASDTNIRTRTDAQGDVRMLKAMNDGTNGTPRTGLTTYGPRIGKYKIIKVI